MSVLSFAWYGALNSCTSMYIGRGQVLFQNLFLTYSPPILGRSDDEICVMHKSRFWLISRPSSPKNEPPCSSLSYKFAGANLLLLGTSGILAQECTSLHILGLRVFLTKNSLLVITPDVLVRFAFPALLQIGGADTRREQKLTAGVLFAR